MGQIPKVFSLASEAPSRRSSRDPHRTRLFGQGTTARALDQRQLDLRIPARHGAKTKLGALLLSGPM
jgi:hypothetical protein